MRTTRAKEQRICTKKTTCLYNWSNIFTTYTKLTQTKHANVSCKRVEI